MKTSFSVLIVAFNASDYIGKCIESILNQTYQNFDVYIVDDGSTDDTLSIIRNYAVENQKINFISIPNSGVSKARNLALDNVNGDYFIFVDSDDYLSSNCLEVLSNNINNNDEIVLFNYNIDLDGVVKEHKFNSKLNKGLDDGFLLESIRAISLEPNPWAKAYKGYLSKEMRYPVGIEYEDLATVFIFLFNKKISILDQRLYYYRIRDNSIMRSFNEKKITDKIKSLSYIKDNIKLRLPDNNQYIQAYRDCYNFHMVFVTSNIIINQSQNIIKDLSTLNSDIDRSMFNFWSVFSSKGLGINYKFYLLLFIISPRLCVFLKKTIVIIKKIKNKGVVNNNE